MNFNSFAIFEENLFLPNILGSLPALAFLFLLSVLCCAEAAKANAKNGMSLMTWLRSMRTKR